MMIVHAYARAHAEAGLHPGGVGLRSRLRRLRRPLSLHARRRATGGGRCRFAHRSRAARYLLPQARPDGAPPGGSGCGRPPSRPPARGRGPPRRAPTYVDPAFNREQSTLIAEVLHAFVVTNQGVDTARTEAARAAARAAVAPVRVSFLRNQVVVEKDTPVTPEAHEGLG